MRRLRRLTRIVGLLELTKSETMVEKRRQGQKKSVEKAVYKGGRLRRILEMI
jgi:hypothetical protein